MLKYLVMLLAVAGLVFAMTPAAQAAVVILSQNFDTDPVNYTNSAFGVGSVDKNDYWALSGTGGMTLNPNFTLASGTYLTGQDMDGGAPLTYTTGAPAYIDFTVSATGYANLKFSIALAGAPAAETANYVRAKLDNDGDSTYETTLFNFVGNNNSAYIDSTLGLGSLGTAFATFSNIALASPTALDGNLRLRLEVFCDTNSLGASSENIGIDNISISGDSSNMISIASADWNTPSTWDATSVPLSYNAVTVNGHAVTVNSAPAVCNSLAFTGTGASVAVTGGQTLTISNPAVTALNTTGGALSLDGSSTLNIPRANTSSSFANLTVGSGTILNVTSELTVDATKNLAGATVNSLKTSVAGGTTLTVTALNVPSAGNLTGSGTVAGLVTVAGGGKVSPGASVGTLTVDGLALSAGSLLDFEFNTTPANDLITVNTLSGLTINGGAISLYNEGGTTPFSTDATYNLIGYSGTIGGAGPSALSVLNKVAGKKYTFAAVAGTPNYVTLTIAQGAYWNGGDGTADWSKPANWTGVSPSTGDILPFATAGGGGTITTLNNDIVGGSFASLQFESGAPAFTLNGNAVTLTGDTSGNVVLNNSANIQTVNLPITLTGPANLNAASGAIVIDSLSTITNGGFDLTVKGAQPVTLNGAFSGLGGVIRSTDAGKLNINSATALGSGTFTINGGTIDNTSSGAVTLSTVTPQTWAGDFTFTGTQDLNLGTGAVTMSASRKVTVSAKTLTVGGPITGTGLTLTKAGAGTLVLSGDSTFSKLAFNGDPGGKVVIDDSVDTTPNVTFTGNTDVDIGSRWLLDINNATVSMGGLKMQGGQLVVRGTSTLNITANSLELGNRDGRRESVYVKNTAKIDGTGRQFRIGTGWTQQTYIVGLKDSAQATFSRIDVLESALYCDGHGHGALLEVANKAQLTSAGDMYVMTSASDNNRTGTIYAYAQVYQHGTDTGSTVNVGGNLRLADQDNAVGTGGATHKVQAVYNLGDNATLNLGGRILGGNNSTGYGQSYFNFRGGKLAYTGAGDQTDWINLTVTAGTAGTTSVNNLRVWEGATIDTGGSDGLGRNLTVAQALLAPTGDGISAIDPAGLGNPGAVYDFDTPPWVYIDGGGGSGATAVARLDSSGVVTSIVVTNPGNGYTSAPTVRLVRNGVGDNNVAAGSITLSANSSYTGGLKKTGLGTLTLTQGLNLSDASANVIEAGTLDLEGATNSLGTISGAGNLTVGAGSAASLTATSIVANTLTIGAGGSVTIRPTATSGASAPVPEPGTWVLIGTALLGLLAWRRRR